MSDTRSRYSLAVLASHPIQYQAPLFRALAARPEIDLHVYFCSRWGLDEYNDPGFGTRVSWDIPLLEGYQSTFLRNLSPWPSPSRFLGLVNPGIVAATLRRRFDALWIHGWALASNWIAWCGAAAGWLPILLRGEAAGLAEPTGLKGAVKRLVLKTLFHRIAGFLAIGTNNANFYRSYGVSEEQIFLTPYAVDNAFFLNHARALEGQKLLLRAKEGLPPDRAVILYCGKFQEKKRPMDLLAAFALLNRNDTASLVFVGDGPLRLEMERFVAERRMAHVYFLGFRNQTELPACYGMADVLVLPSGFEPWGLVLNEAMCFGLPVIVSDRVGAAADLVRNGVNGFIYPAGNIHALADRLQRVLANEQARGEMGKQSCAIINRWGFEEDIAGLLNALHAVAGAKT